MNRFTVLLIGIGSILPVQALTVDSKAGLLSSMISEPSAVSELVLTGTADASDLYFIDRSMPALRSLDMSGLDIVEYTGAPLGGFSRYEAGLIPAAVFAGSGLQTVVLPSGCSVGDFAFAGSALVEINVPRGISVGDGAFSHCAALEKVTVAPEVTLGHSTFRACEKLSTVAGADNIVSIPEQTFEDCAALEEFDFSPSLRSIGAGAFASTSVIEVDLSDCSSLDSIGSWAFAGDRALVSVVLPEDAALGQGVFFECTSLNSILLPDGMAELPAYTLKDVSALKTDFVLPEGMVSVGDYAFMGASGITSVELPSSLQKIGEGAMEDMSSLESVDATALYSVPELGDSVWAGVNQKNVILTVAPSTLSAFNSADQWQEFDVQGESNLTGLDMKYSRAIRAAFDGYILVVESTGEPIERIAIYDVAGTTLFSRTGLDENVLGVDTSAFSAAVYIVDCTLSDGTRGTLKILR